MAQGVVQTFLNYEAELRQWIAQNLPAGFMSDKFMEIANSIISWISTNFSASNAISGHRSRGSVVNVAIGAIVSIYLMKDMIFPQLMEKAPAPASAAKRAIAAVTETPQRGQRRSFQFVRGALLDAVIVAILSSIGLSVIGLDFAVFIGYLQESPI